MARKKKTAKIISVINMKGGVGKTTTSSNLFREIFRYHRKKILLIDFDAQFNLTQSLVKPDQYQKHINNGKTIYHLMTPLAKKTVFDICKNDSVKIEKFDNYIVRLKRLRLLKGESEKDQVNLYLLPGNFEISNFNLVEDRDALEIPMARLKKFIEDVKEVFDIIVFDCNPSSSFLTRTAIELSTNLLIPVKPDKYSILGVKMIFDYMDRIPSFKDRKKVHIILNDVPRSNYDSTVEDELRGDGDYGPITLAEKLHRSTILHAAADYTGFSVDKPVPHKKKLLQNLRDIASEYNKKLGF